MSNVYFCAMKNLALDFGNTRIKAGIFHDHELVEQKIFDEAELLPYVQAEVWSNTIISSVRQEATAIHDRLQATGKKILLTYQTALPIHLHYRTPQTLGVDRIAAACGALEIFPQQNCLVIDAGTCINYEFIDEHQRYHGGAISPGIAMRFEAMHTFTAKLPLVNAIQDAALIGDDTISCMQSGVINGAIAEVKEIIAQYESRYRNLGVILCGGDFTFFEKKLKPSIFVAPDLVLRGLNRILLHNAG